MLEEHHYGLCPALCLRYRLEYMMTSRGHERKRSAIAERSTPNYAGAQALRDLSDTVLWVGLLAVEPRDDTSQLCGPMCDAGGPSLFEGWAGRNCLCKNPTAKSCAYGHSPRHGARWPKAP